MINLFKKRAALIILLLIFLVGIFLRFYQLSKIPSGFHIDEAISGANAYSLLKTGKDTNNTFLPLSTNVFGDDNPTGYAYLTVLPVKLFGLTEFATRFPGALFGSLTVLAFFIFTLALFQNTKVALLASFLLAVAPWHIMLSRSSEQTLVGLFFLILGFAYLFLSIRTKQQRYIFFAGAIFVLSYFTYFVPRIFVPMFFFVLCIALFKTSLLYAKGFKAIFFSLFLCLSLLSLILVFVFKGGSSRLNQISIFGFPETQLVMDEQIREDGAAGTPLVSTRIFHNKIINYSLTFVSNYIEYFSGNFLFIKGGLPIWFQVPSMGLLYLVELPFILFGASVLVQQKKQFAHLLFIWLLLAPITAAVTVDDIPNIRRSIAMFPILELLAAYGFISFSQRIPSCYRKASLLFLLLIFFCNVAYFFHQYFIHTKTHRTWYRSNGFSEMMDVVKKSYDKYDKIVIAKQGAGVYPLVLFYMRYDPAIYQREGLPKDKEYQGFGKFIFVPQNCPSTQQNDRYPISSHIIYINAAECKETFYVKYQKAIFKQDGTKAYKIQFVDR